METGNLDRVLHGMAAEDVLSACDEHSLQASEVGLANPAVHFFRGLKSKNLAAIRHAAQVKTAIGICNVIVVIDLRNFMFYFFKSERAAPTSRTNIELSSRSFGSR